jgi:hypothetical protein
MVGVDTHGYQPAPPVWAHMVGISFGSPAALTSKLTPRVKSDGLPMLQQGYDVYLVPHVPVPLTVPAPLAPAQLANIIAASGTKAQLAVRSVTGQGQKLACAVSGLLGLNVNCNDPLDLPNGCVIQVNTVQTRPTKGDLAAAAMGGAADAILGALAGLALDAIDPGELAELIMKHLLRRVPEIFGEQADLPGKVADWVQDLIDGEQKGGA